MERLTRMVTREEIKAEVDKVPEEWLEQLYRVVRTFSLARSSGAKESFLMRLSRIQIEGPEDFAANFDLYLNGSKSIN